METRSKLEQRLEAFPELRHRVEQILAIAENKEGKFIYADEVEDRVTEELQKLGREVLQGWAEKESQRQSQQLKEKEPKVYRNGKKNFTGTPNTDRST